MPEGPEVKTIARTLKDQLVGQRLGAFWHGPHRLRRSADVTGLLSLENSLIDDVSCYGKVLFVHSNKKPIVFAQLGMTGQLTVEPSDKPLLPHPHVRWALKGKNSEIRYVDARRFGLIDKCDEKIQADIIGKLGPDPFSIKPTDH